MISSHNLLVTLGMDIRGFDVQGISCSHVGAHVTRRPSLHSRFIEEVGRRGDICFASFFLPENSIPNPMGELRYTVRFRAEEVTGAFSLDPGAFGFGGKGRKDRSTNKNPEGCFEDLVRRSFSCDSFIRADPTTRAVGQVQNVARWAVVKR